MMRYLILLEILFMFTALSACKANKSGDNQQKKAAEQNQNNIRQPVAAGRFYPANADKLRSQLDSYFSYSEYQPNKNTTALIVPHAGYIYSGTVAATGFNEIDTTKDYNHIFILGSSHTTRFKGASIYHKGNYKTPLGQIQVDQTLARKLITNHSFFKHHAEAHTQEHSIEVELPFIQYRLGKKASIVPIILGTHSKQTCKKIGQALAPYFNSNNLFIISSDFSHYPPYEDAKKIDKETAQAIASNNPDKFLETIQKHKTAEIPQLKTSMCGWTSALSLLYITSELDNVSIHTLQYQNAGDSPAGNKDRVVGYYAIDFTMEQSKNSTTAKKTISMEQFDLTTAEKKLLLNTARETIKNHLQHKDPPVLNSSEITSTLQQQYGAFVTLRKDKNLRGCIGNFQADTPLYKTIQKMAVSAATKDPRFPPVSMDELDQLDIEVSVLSPMKKVDSIEEIEVGKHGIYIKKGMQSGTLLPQVAEENGWSKEEFLGHCSKSKAGLGWNGWKDPDTEVYIYEAKVFSEKDLID